MAQSQISRTDYYEPSYSIHSGYFCKEYDFVLWNQLNDAEIPVNPGVIKKCYSIRYANYLTMYFPSMGGPDTGGPLPSQIQFRVTTLDPSIRPLDYGVNGQNSGMINAQLTSGPYGCMATAVAVPGVNDLRVVLSAKLQPTLNQLPNGEAFAITAFSVTYAVAP
jgi:hypothetical protein